MVLLSERNTFRVLQTCVAITVVLQICMNLAALLNLAVKLECVPVVLFVARCCLTPPRYPLQCNKDVVVLVRCSQQLIRERIISERTNTIAIGGLLEEKKYVCFQ